MKLIMTLLVRDEEDILEANINFHLAQGVDFFIATDNLSVDSTPDILRSYERRGLLHYILEQEDNYNQHAWVTRMARIACTDFGADWVINNDADEFWWPETGDLKSTLAGLPDEVNIVRAQRINFVVVGEGQRPFYEEMVYRERKSFNPLGKPLPPKVAHRASPEIRVKQGNHAVEGMEDPVIRDGALEILHFPVRTLRQLENKIRKGGAAYARNTELPEAVGNTWRAMYRDLKKDSSLADHFRQYCYPTEKLYARLDSGDLLLDTRLRDFLHRLAAASKETAADNP